MVTILADGGHDEDVAVEEDPGDEEEEAKHLRWNYSYYSLYQSIVSSRCMNDEQMLSYRWTRVVYFWRSVMGLSCLCLDYLQLLTILIM